MLHEQDQSKCFVIVKRKVHPKNTNYVNIYPHVVPNTDNIQSKTNFRKISKVFPDNESEWGQASKMTQQYYKYNKGSSLL